MAKPINKPGSRPKVNKSTEQPIRSDLDRNNSTVGTILATNVSGCLVHFYYFTSKKMVDISIKAGESVSLQDIIPVRKALKKFKGIINY